MNPVDHHRIFASWLAVRPTIWVKRIGSFVGRLGRAASLGLMAATAHAQVSVSPSGLPGYELPIAVPPGVRGLEPVLSLKYSANRLNGPVGYGWAMQGASVISRCRATRATDGSIGGGTSGVQWASSDKLCLDGQRLVRIVPSTGAALVGAGGTDAAGPGLAVGAFAEYRTENDSYARIRAYGIADGSNASSGPLYFRVWSKNGRITDYGNNPTTSDANTNATIGAFYPPQALVHYAQLWAVSRIADVFGNHIDFKYSQTDRAWGSNGAYQSGHEWNLQEIQYGGNKVIFSYVDRTQLAIPDGSEAYNNGAKNISTQRLASVATYVSSPNTGTLGPAVSPSAVPVATYKLAYVNGVNTHRSLLSSFTDCAGNGAGACLPPTTFTYQSGGSTAYVAHSVGDMTTAVLPVWGPFLPSGALVFDANGDGRDDILVWDDYTTSQLWLSNGDGTFTKSPKYNITEKLYGADVAGGSLSCYVTLVADFNGDGLPDLIRVSNPSFPIGTGNQSDPCSNTQPTKIWMNNGDGSFAPPITLALPNGGSIGFQQLIYGCVGTGLVNANGRPFNCDGISYYILDVDGDGIADIVTTLYPTDQVAATVATVPPYTNPCVGRVCTRVFHGVGDGTFTEMSTNMSGFSLHPDGQSGFRQGSHPAQTIDVDGDGLSDIVIDIFSSQFLSNYYAARSHGDGNFDLLPAPSNRVSPYNAYAKSIDYNGSGRTSVLYTVTDPTYNSMSVQDLTLLAPSKVSNFNLTSSTNQLRDNGFYSKFTYDNRGSRDTIVGDFNGDGRQDLLSWMSNENGGTTATTTLYLSNGDGTFSVDPTFSLGGSTTVPLGFLCGSVGLCGVLSGDFTGHGNVELIQTQGVQSGKGDGLGTFVNTLYTKADFSTPDMLSTVTTGAGALTRITYASLGNPTLGAGDVLAPRYVSDRGSSYAASAPIQDAAPRGTFVAQVQTDTGIGTGGSSLTTDYRYQGLKLDLNGRGSLGFRRVLNDRKAPNGADITTDSTYFQVVPYIGMPVIVSGYNAAMPAIASTNLLTGTTNIYCDQTAVANADSAAISNGVSCAPTANAIRRPYLAWTQTAARDPAGASLPTKTVRKSGMTVDGDATTVTETTAMPGSTTDTFSRITTNSYTIADNVSCQSDQVNCNWILGQSAFTQVEGVAPSASLATSAGTTAGSTQTSGAPTLSLVAGAVNWGVVGAGSDSGDLYTVSNQGTIPVLLTGAAVAGPAGTWAYQGSSSSGYCLIGTTVLAPGASCINFVGTGTANVPGSYGATLTVSYQAQGVSASTYTAQLAYAFGIAASTASPAAVNFGVVTVGPSSGNVPVTLTNPSKESFDNLSIATTGANAGNFAVTNNCGTSVPANGSCTVSISASTSTVGVNYAASLQVSGSYARVQSTSGGAFAKTTYYPDPQTLAAIALAATGGGSIGTLTSAATITMPAVWYGSASQALTATYRNDGNQAMTLLSPGLVAPLSVSSNTCAAVAPGASCNLGVAVASNVPGNSSVQTFAPVGANVRPATTSVSWTTLTAVPHWNPTSLSFSNVEDGMSASQNITLINDGDTSYNWAANSAIANAPSGFSFNSGACGNVAPGANCNVVVTFSPTFGNLTYSGTGISMSAASYNTNTFSVTGTGITAPIISTLPTLYYNTSYAPTPVSASVAISNGGQTPTTLSLSLTGGASLSTTTLACPASGSCGAVTVTTPTAVGNYSGTFSMTSSAGGSVTGIPMTMIVQAPPTASITPVAFGIIFVSQTSTLHPATITNTGSSPVVMTVPSAASVTGTGFSFSSTTCTTTLAVGATCTVTVGFKPPNTGIYSGQLTVQSNAGTLTSALTGSGKPIHN